MITITNLQIMLLFFGREHLQAFSLRRAHATSSVHLGSFSYGTMPRIPVKLHLHLTTTVDLEIFSLSKYFRGPP